MACRDLCDVPVNAMIPRPTRGEMLLKGYDVDQIDIVDPL
jgi:hypothetical protein